MIKKPERVQERKSFREMHAKELCKEYKRQKCKLSKSSSKVLAVYEEKQEETLICRNIELFGKLMAELLYIKRIWSRSHEILILSWKNSLY